MERRVVSKNAAIVDLGCGTGGTVQYLFRNGYTNCTGIDLSPIAVRYTVNRGLKAEIGDISDLSRYPDCTFDVALSNDVLYFIPPEQRPAVLAGIRRILKPGGLFLLNLPVREIFSGSHDGAVGITKRICPREFAGILEGGGFRIERTAAWPFLLAPMIASVRTWQRQRIRFFSGDEKGKVSSDVRPISPIMNFTFDLITRAEQILPDFIRQFGSSQLYVCSPR